MAECKKELIREAKKEIIETYPVSRRLVGTDYKGKQIDAVTLHEVYTTTPAEHGYVLTLSQDEADLMLDILRNVGGCPIGSRRKFADQVRRAIAGAGVLGKGTADFSSFPSRHSIQLINMLKQEG